MDIHWQCQLNHLATEKDQAGALFGGSETLTVGEPFMLTCQGPEAAGIDVQASALELPKEQQYALRVLKNLGMDAHKVTFVVTSYSVNPSGHQFQNIFLADGKTRIALDGITFKVKSVITKENNPKNQPFPPWGPFGFTYPSWIWVGLAILLIFISSICIEKVLLALKRKKFFKLLANNPPVLSAYHQLSKELRKFSREALRPQDFTPEVSLKFVNELRASYRWYLSRQLEFSCFDQSAVQIVRTLQQQDELLVKKIGHSLSLALIEIERWQRRSKQIKLEDAIQLLEMVRLSAEELQKYSRDKSENRKSRPRLEAEV